jgi:cell division protease FtsH
MNPGACSAHKGLARKRDEMPDGRQWNNPVGPNPPQGPRPLGGRKGPGSMRYLLWLLLLIILVPWLYRGCTGQFSRAREIDYSNFIALVQMGRVEKVTMQDEKIEGVLKKASGTAKSAGQTAGQAPAAAAKQTGAPRASSTPADTSAKASGLPGGLEPGQTFVTYMPSMGDDKLLPLLEAQDVALQVKPSQNFSWWLILVNALPFLLLIGLGVLFINRMRSQGQQVFSIGRSRAKQYERTDEGTTFDDVAGAEGAKVELREIITFLRHPGRFRRLGGAAPKGVLLVGPPGTGKTLLARATAGEAEVPFFSITGSDFMEMFVGVGASRVRSLFEDARKSAPSIIFIDELDSIGRQRGAGLGGGHDEREQTLNQLLSEMDGFEPTLGIVVMAATNRPDILDSALLRPGRFDRRITVELPGVKARLDILKIHSRNKPLDAEVDLEDIARGTPGFSGADLANLLNEAALLAGRRDRESIQNQDIEEARDKVMLGLRREGLELTREELRMLAYHEGGHAVLAAVLPHTDLIHKVTIVPRGRALGVTQQLPEKDRYIYDREYLFDRLVVLMGGRTAERLVFETSTTGAENDLKEATRIARKMVLDWGMSERLGDLALGDEREHVFLGGEIGHRRHYSEATAREVDEEVRAIVREADGRARELLSQHREALDRLAEALVAEEEVSGQRVLDIIQATPSKTGP